MIDISVFFKDDEKAVDTSMYEDFAVVNLRDRSNTLKLYLNSWSKNTRQAREFASQILKACDAMDAANGLTDEDEDFTAVTD